MLGCFGRVMMVGCLLCDDTAEKGEDITEGQTGGRVVSEAGILG